MNIFVGKFGNASIYIRPWQESYIPSLIENANSKEVCRFMRNAFPHPYTNEDALIFLNIVRSNPEFSYAIVQIDSSDNATGASSESSEIAIGAIGMKTNAENEINAHNVELGYWLGKNYWGRGIASAAVGKFVNDPHWINRRVRIRRIEAMIDVRNLGSSRVLEKNGFQLDGILRDWSFKDGQFSDAKIYSLLLPLE